MKYVRCSQLALSAMHRRQVNSLLRHTKGHKMLDRGRNIVALQALDVLVPDLTGEIRIFGKSLFNL